MQQIFSLCSYYINPFDMLSEQIAAYIIFHNTDDKQHTVNFFLILVAYSTRRKLVLYV